MWTILYILPMQLTHYKPATQGKNKVNKQTNKQHSPSVAAANNHLDFPCTALLCIQYSVYNFQPYHLQYWIQLICNALLHPCFAMGSQHTLNIRGNSILILLFCWFVGRAMRTSCFCGFCLISIGVLPHSKFLCQLENSFPLDQRIWGDVLVPHAGGSPKDLR